MFRFQQQKNNMRHVKEKECAPYSGNRGNRKTSLSVFPGILLADKHLKAALNMIFLN